MTSAATGNDSVLSTFDGWRPLLDQLAPTVRDRPVRCVGNVSAGACGSTGVGDAVSLPRNLTDYLFGAVGDLDIDFCATVFPGNRAEVLILDTTTPQLRAMADLGSVEGVVLVPGSLPEPYRRPVQRFAEHAMFGGGDPVLTESIIREVRPDAVGATEAQLDAAEARIGYPLPADVRAMYRVAAEGEVLMLPGGVAVTPEMRDDPANEERLWDAFDFFIIPVDDLDGRAYAAPLQRMTSWRFGAGEVISPDPLGRIQPVGASPAWFVFAADGSGGFYAVDLEPGPGGCVGQVLHMDRDQAIGATWVAPSLTGFLVGGGSDEPGHFYDEDSEERLVIRVGDHTRRWISDVAPQTEVLHINRLVDRTVDLRATAGHPRLRTVSITEDVVTGLGALRELPALEYLELTPNLWRSMIAHGDVPATLLAAGIEGPAASFEEPIGIANQLLRLRGLPPVPVTRLRPGAAPDLVYL
ncbi:SMI1/KNR4 family protein [Gordonia soli]|uniref:Knr4/Smi1-like domain-containing protein n=1 Tax=Gordonia soli NBRC 108243 TaxID=1223545 RepID=M0QGP5_9ACTN|nr:SMI1/KNR4 family protein [Gordonia soli]GAC67461.1 hypothetical protein GS4_08_00450 [Gordonia soli NBRC 108243]